MREIKRRDTRQNTIQDDISRNLIEANAVSGAIRSRYYPICNGNDTIYDTTETNVISLKGIRIEEVVFKLYSDYAVVYRGNHLKILFEGGGLY